MALRIVLARFLTLEGSMRQPTNRQLLLPLTAERAPGGQLPQENHDRCRTLLARLLAQVIRAESDERRSNEQREDPSDPS
jgi:hypothetical protein